MNTDLSKHECEDFLASNHYAHLAYIDGDEPSVLPITYVFEKDFIFGFTHEGHKIDVMRKHPKICIQVEEIQNARNWTSVMCWGMYEEITDEASKQNIKLLFGQQHGKGILEKGEAPVSPMVAHISEDRSGDAHHVIYRMKPYKMTGKAERP